MASGSGPKVRFVKCPKCLRVLLEDQDVPVYQCGGCFTILQAKKRNISANCTPSSAETEGIRPSESQRASEFKGSTSSSPDLVVPSSGEFSESQEYEKGQSGSVDSIDEQLAGFELSNGEKTDGIQPRGTSAGDSERNEGDNSTFEADEDTEAVAAEQGSNSGSSSPDLVVPSSGEFSAGQEHEKGQSGSVDSIDEQLTGFELSNGEKTDGIQPHGTSAGDSERNEGDNSIFEADEDTEAVAAEQGSNSGSLSVDNVAAVRERTLSVNGSPRQGAESSPSDILTASPDEEEHDQGNDYRGHPQGESTDDLQSRDSLANKILSAYDGSVSSSDGREDQLPNSARVSPEERLRGKSVMQDHFENKERGTSSSAMLSKEKHNERHKKRDQNRSLQVEGSGERLDRHWRRQETQEFRSYMPYYRKGPSFSSAYEHGSPSYQSHDDFDSRSRAYSLQMPPYGGGRHSGPGLQTNQEGFDRYGILTRAGDWGQTSRVPRIPFSGEPVMNRKPFSGEPVMNRRHHAGHTCWCSGQLHTSYNSYPGSPQRHMEPEYYPGWSREIVSDVEDQHRRGGRHEVQTYLRERRPVAKRHVRPTVGGAPFTSCYHCSATLQLPADFLIFHRKYHFLRCGTCRNVLRFSLQDRTHLVPAIIAPQPESSHDINAHGSSKSASGSSRNEVPKPEKRSSSAKNEELPTARGSPLHRLMGYTSVSQVFKVSPRPPSPRISDYDQTSKH